MALRRPILTTLHTPPSTPIHVHIRHLHARIPPRPIPAPTPFIPDTPTFLTVIGRNLSAHAAKIPTWESLFSLSSAQLRAAGVEPARARRYLLHWREKFRNGEFGVGGNAKYVKDGAAELRVIEVPTTSPRFAAATATRAAGHRKVAVNVPAGTEKVDVGAKGEVVPVLGVRVRGAQTISGPHVEIIKGTGGLGARIRVKEGLWEEKRGRIVDGGERRRAEVRAKRRAEERKTSRA
ncbi:telomere length regulation protein [Coniosporium apollinis]|uniref:Small ribosomal subunit protein mS41 n=1 Tax=Coniosporium apollinis TaxID=61459 RepID=A0ABQ9NSJ7_9PEZI|nr:telomere length regulation protein [Coniosporium apollinis]